MIEIRPQDAKTLSDAAQAALQHMGSSIFIEDVQASPRGSQAPIKAMSQVVYRDTFGDGRRYLITVVKPRTLVSIVADMIGPGPSIGLV